MSDTEKKAVNPVIDDEHEKRWYVVNTYSGHENRVKENLEKRVESMGIQDSLFRILVAEEPVIDVKNNKQVERMQNMFPGYAAVSSASAARPSRPTSSSPLLRDPSASA